MPLCITIVGWTDMQDVEDFPAENDMEINLFNTKESGKILFGHDELKSCFG